MHDQILPLLELNTKDPKERGQQHGESLRDKIGEIAEIRLERMCNSSYYTNTKDVLELAHKHIIILEKFDHDLYKELIGISKASNISLERLIVLNHFTDMRDIKPGDYADAGGCSIIYSPTAFGPLLGQTWDIHASALPYAIALKFNDIIVFSIAGCLGIAGMNIHDVALAINNLSSIDAHIGVPWPALVRKALTKKSAQEACDEIMKAPIGSGRHFAIADKNNFFGIETSGRKKKIICTDSDKLYFHTNHCLDTEMRNTHVIRKDSTTLERFDHLDTITRYEDLSTISKVFLAFAPLSIPVDKSSPHKTATCGTMVFDPANKSMLACKGIANEELLSCPSSIISFKN
jgi:isopenicillin-N N-acyltransferase-like protein